MSFGEAVTTCLKKYATFTGRARRSEYWYFMLFLTVVVGGLFVLSQVTKNSAIVLVMLAVELAFLLPALAATVRRLHDTGRSGWWYFIGFVPFVGGIALLIFMLDDTDSEGDKFGPAPKAVYAS